MRKLSSTQLLVLGFLAIILLGSLALLLPVCHRESTGFLDALFTATSAVCVTGLVVVETGTHWTLVGQLVILLLIQVGGLGFMSMTSLFLTASGRRISLKERLLIQEGISHDGLQSLSKFSFHICRIAFTIEGAGMLLLAFALIPRFGFFRGLYYSLFLSVSAFCNAGFDVLGLGDSVACFADSPYILGVLMALIVLGGLGFMVIMDLRRRGRSRRRLQLHTKIVVTATLVLLLGGFGVFLFCEHDNPGTLGGMAWGGKVLNALFQSVTVRTAGFATFDQNQLTRTGKFVSALLMFIGASPASTGGGIKTTTVACVALAVLAFLRGRPSVSAFKRKLPEDQVLRALSIFFIALFCLLVCALLLSGEGAEGTQALSMENLIYESASALGTAGLTAGVTAQLSVRGRLLLILAMFAGRVGPLSLTLAVSSRLNRLDRVKMEYPEEKIIVG